jgi:pilus assembly protein CpaE
MAAFQRALVVANAAGAPESANAVLQRFGITTVATAATPNDALQLLRGQEFDLFIAPMQSLDAVDLAAFERETRRHSTMLVIGTAPVAEADLILRAVRAGVQEFLVYPPDAKELSAAIDRLLRRRGDDGPRGRLIAVYGAKGGIGATTIAINLAFSIARLVSTGRVALVDLVASGGDVCTLLGLKPAHDLSLLASKGDALDAELVRATVTPADGGVWVLPSPMDPEAGESVTGDVVQALLEQMRTSYAHTVIDVEHWLGERSVAALDAADEIVMVTQLDVSSLRRTQRVLTVFRRLGYGDDKVRIVVNRAHDADLLSLTDAREVLFAPIEFTIPNDFRGCADAATRGRPMVLSAPSSGVAAAVTQLARDVAGLPTNGKSGAPLRATRLGRLLRRTS